jgi:hypothetical protein
MTRSNGHGRGDASSIVAPAKAGAHEHPAMDVFARSGRCAPEKPSAIMGPRLRGDDDYGCSVAFPFSSGARNGNGTQPASPVEARPR